MMKRLQCLMIKPLRVVLLLALPIFVATQSASISSQHFPSSYLLQDQCPFSWALLTPAGDFFSVQMPKRTSPKPLDMQNAPNLIGDVYTASDGRISYTVKSVKYMNAALTDKERLENFRNLYRESLVQSTGDARTKLIVKTEQQRDGFIGEQLEVITSGKRGLAHIYVRGQRVYVLEVSAARKDDALTECFLSSFKLTEMRGPVQTPTPSPDPTPKPVDPLFCECGPGYGKEIPGDRFNHDVVMCPMPKVEDTREACKHQYSDSALLRLQLSATGEVTLIEVIKRLPYGLTENVIDAAKKIKFCPAVKNGIPVDVILTLTFTYTCKEVNAPRRIGRTPRRRP